MSPAPDPVPETDRPIAYLQRTRDWYQGPGAAYNAAGSLPD